MAETTYKLNTLRHWYLEERIYDGKPYQFIRGQFFNRPGFFDGDTGRTSYIKSITLNEAENEYEIQTRNTLYHCSFDSCHFDLQDKSPYTLPEYERIKKEYYHPDVYDDVSQDDMLLVLADYEDFFFKKLVYRNEDGSFGGYSGYPHIGMCTDSYLISEDPKTCGDGKIDIRYYVHAHGIEFYTLQTDNKTLWIENKGETPITIEIHGGQLVLEPGERIKYLEKQK